MYTIVSLAKELINGFTTTTNAQGYTIRILREDYKYHDQLHSLVYECHENSLPNDWVYDTVYQFLSDISELDNEYDLDDVRDEIVIEADTYNKDLLNWFNRFYNYCDLVVQEYDFNFDNKSVIDLLSLGQAYHKEQILNTVLNCLKSILDEIQ